MSINGILFLFCFLPIALLLYYIADNKIKEYVLLFISLFFYALGSLEYIFLFLCSIIVNIFLGRSIHVSTSKKMRRLLLVGGIVFNSGILIYYKYSDFIINNINKVTGSNHSFLQLALPLGISFFTFKAISYLTDIYNDKAVLSDNPIHDALYLSFFAQIQSGPLTRYNDMIFPTELKGNKSARTNSFSDGVFRFLIGFNKKVLLANVLSKISTEVFSAPIENCTASYVWLGSICYSLQLFFDFAGYSDMAIGLSEMFGYKCIENFYYPYLTESVSKFWRRWHISLSEWLRDYIYIPLGGSRSTNKLLVYRNLFVVWLLTGIWHGASWNFIFWGLGYFVLISFERITKLPERFKYKISRSIYRVFTLIFINCQWVVFRSPTLKSGLKFIKVMFFGKDNDGTANMRTIFLLKEYSVFILAAVILCFPVVKWIGGKIENKKRMSVVYETFIALAVLGLFICALSFVVANKNNPFAYANF